MIVGFSGVLRFSSDGRLLYFTTPTWARSGAVHVVDTATREEHFICDGNLSDIQSSTSGDLLIVDKAKYNPRRAAGLNSIPDYYQAFLVSLDGEEIKAVGSRIVP